MDRIGYIDSYSILIVRYLSFSVKYDDKGLQSVNDNVNGFRRKA